MIQINREVWGGIPVLICSKKALAEVSLPTVTYLHGFTGAKEDNLSIAYLLAEKDYRVILPDAYLHGERENDQINSLEFHFFEIIQKNIMELNTIYTHLVDRKLIDNHSFTLAGTSMGGISTAACLTVYPWISEAGMMMGTAFLHQFSESLINHMLEKNVKLPVSNQELDELLHQLKQYDLSLNIDRLQNRRLFIWHGEQDQLIPYHHATSFYHQLREEPSLSRAVTFVNEKNTGHKVTRQARLALVDWLTKA